MKDYKLVEVLSDGERKQFLALSETINGNDPNWVRPLDNVIEDVFDPNKNVQFQAGEAIRWILYSGDKVIGRIAAFYNHESAAKEEQLTGGCGFFECVDNQTAANLLFDAARDWLAAHGMEAMDGSINFGDRMFWWGVLVEGFTMPLYGMNYNQPYYGALFENYGFQNYFNQYVYLRPLGPDVHLSDALLEKAERLYANSDYEFRTCDMKNLGKMAADFRIVYNSGWAKFEGVKPLTLEHAMEMMSSMKPIIDPEIMYFAYYKGEPVGFFIMIPDLNQIIGDFKGRFSLIQKLRMMYRLKISKRVNRISGIVFGVAAEQQGKGVEAGMIRQFEIYTQRRREQGREQYKTLEMMWIGDFNPVMMRMCESYVNSTKYKRFVTYRYLFDHSKPFKRCPRMGAKSAPKSV